MQFIGNRKIASQENILLMMQRFFAVAAKN
jgi:hypothetical protein